VEELERFLDIKSCEGLVEETFKASEPK